MQLVLWLWYMNWNKRVCSERRKSHFRGPRFQNFAGEDTPGPPTNAKSYVCISQLRSWIHPWAGMHEIAVNVIVHYKASASVAFLCTNYNGLNTLCGVFILHLLRKARGCCMHVFSSKFLKPSRRIWEDTYSKIVR
jgi:hypothetical protein